MSLAPAHMRPETFASASAEQTVARPGVRVEQAATSVA
jgi:hypothetical protein